jgi:predicted MFS family arabinose efflux permease
VLGTAETVFDNAGQSVLPQIVTGRQLQHANAVQYAGQTVTERFVGPPVGSLLFAACAALPFGLDAVSFLVCAALIVRLPLRARPPVDPPPRATSLRAEIVEGLRWLWSHRLLRGLALLVGVNNLANQMAWATLVLLATDTFGLSARAYGLLLAGQAVGGVLGSVVNRPLVRTLGSRNALVAALCTTALAYLGAGLAPDVVVVGVLFALVGVASMVWNVVTVSLRQDVVPAGLLGRVNSAYRMLGWGMIPIGGAAGGFVAHWLGLRAPLLLAGGLRLAALAAAVPLLSAAGRHLGGRIDD